MDHAPIVIFTYRRADATRQMLRHLADCPELCRSRVIVYSDGPREGHEASVAELRNLLDRQRDVRIDEWVRRDVNVGLRKSIEGGVREVLEAYDKIIVLEEDLLVSVGFLRYMNHALLAYEEDPRIYQVSGHSFPVLPHLAGHAALLPATTTWGWGTWKRAWAHYEDAPKEVALLDQPELARAFDMDGVYPYTQMLRNSVSGGKVDSWGIRFWWSVFRRGGLSVFPFPSLVHNDGFGAGATHTGGEGRLSRSHWAPGNQIHYWPSSPFVEESHVSAWQAYLRPSLLKRILQ